MKTMKAVVVREPGGPPALQLAELPMPQPGPGEVRIRSHVVGVNYVDVYHRSGAFPLNPPHVPGMEAAGTLDALGEGVTGLAVGDRVAYTEWVGAYAEYVVVPARLVVPVPGGLDLEVAAAAMMQGLTAHYLAHDAFALGPGRRALVHAAAGGVGRPLVQMARGLGATAIGVVSSPAKRGLAETAGARHVLVARGEPFADDVRALTGGEGVDVVYDSVGRATFSESLRCLRPRGTMVLYGQASGKAPPLDPFELARAGSLFLTWPILGDYVATREAMLGRAGAVFSAVARGDLVVRVEGVLPLDEAAAAHAELESRGARGKLLLRPLATA